ncbi:helix-turn-helix domain-containing protein [Paenibacillus sambharensis]|uniref:helix-turn-helix domain-containing protein n=1 Tax=Paenibacillus sambharensis TaxID=1803190 RepID=UPI001FEA070C|nr:helix-turn-helix domain-containing protein [Paenibacillus sambharensis]
MRRKNLLAQTLISYLLVLLFPVMVILLYYYPSMADSAKEKEMDWNAHVTEQFMNAMDIFTRYAYNLPAELVQNREIKMYMAGESDYQRVTIAREMRKYNATDALIDNTLLYVKHLGFMFSKTGSAYKMEDFSRPGVGYYYENWPAEQMVAELDKLAAPAVRPVENVIVPGSNRSRMLTLLLPLPIGGANPPGAVMILVKEETIIRLMKSVSEVYRGSFFIFDGDNNRLVASEETPYMGGDDFRQLVAGLGNSSSGSDIHRVGGESYIVSYTVSDRNGWKYLSLLPVAETVQDIRIIQRNTFVLLGLILLLEMVVIYISIRKNYHPIKRLVDLALHLFEPANSDARPMSEIETIRYALDELSITNSKLDERVKRTLPIMRENVLYELTSGHYADWDTFCSAASACEIIFSHRFITVAVFSCETGEEGLGRIAALCRLQEEELPEGIQGFFFRGIYSQEMVLVMCHHAEVELKPLLERIGRQLEGRMGIPVWIGMGSTAQAGSIEGVHLSYLQAVRTTELLRIGKQCQVLAFHELEVAQTGAVTYFAELLQSLELAILKNDKGLIECFTERIVDYISGRAIPPYLVRSVFLHTISVIFNGLQRFRHDDVRLLRLSDAVYRHRYTTDEMAGILRESSGKLCAIIRSTLPVQEPGIITREDLVTYLEEKAADPGLSLQIAADYFGMSPSNFSHFFKKTVGQNYKEYLDRLRVQRSIQLLRSGTDTVESIAQQTGFSNPASYIRTFKKITGTTPGQYRETHRHEL